MKDDNAAGLGMTSARTRERLIKQLRELGIQNKDVLESIRIVPRHIFLDEALSHRAYDNVALPIGQGQTISSPYIVAKMTELAVAENSLDKVLEIGTGCGYQTAVLARHFKNVYSIERISVLLNGTKARLQSLNLYNIRTRHGDGLLGWPEVQPFNAIVVTAAVTQELEVLAHQLAVGGRMIYPYGKNAQELKIIERTATGFINMRLEKVHFVPLITGTI